MKNNLNSDIFNNNNSENQNNNNIQEHLHPINNPNSISQNPQSYINSSYIYNSLQFSSNNDDNDISKTPKLSTNSNLNIPNSSSLNPNIIPPQFQQNQKFIPINPIFILNKFHLQQKQNIFKNTTVSTKCQINNIPDNISDNFIQKLLEICGSVNSWKRMIDSDGKLSNFGICDYLTVEGLLKCYRLLNNYPLLNSRLQVKLGAKTEEYIKKWREYKNFEFIENLRFRGIPVDQAQLKEKLEKGENLEWEIDLIKDDSLILNQINELVINRFNINNNFDEVALQVENPQLYLKDFKQITNRINIIENEREKERKLKKKEKIKRMERKYNELEKKLIKMEENYDRKEKDKIVEKEILMKRKQKLIEKDLNYDSEEEKKKIMENSIKYKEHLIEREKEKNNDEKIRKKDNDIVFKDIDLEKKNLDNKKKENNSLISLEKKKYEAKTKIEVSEYNINENINDNNNIKPSIELKLKSNNNNNNNYGLILKNINNKNNTNNIIKKYEEDEDNKLYINKNIKIDFNIDNEFRNKLNEIEDKENNQNNNEGFNNFDDDDDNYKYDLKKVINKLNPEKYKNLQRDIYKLIPNDINEIFNFKINWKIYNKYNIEENKIKNYVEKKLKVIFNEDDNNNEISKNFSSLILEKIQKEKPITIYNSLKEFLQDETDVRIYLFYFYRIFLLNYGNVLFMKH